MPRVEPACHGVERTRQRRQGEKGDGQRERARERETKKDCCPPDNAPWLKTLKSPLLWRDSAVSRRRLRTKISLKYLAIGNMLRCEIAAAKRDYAGRARRWYSAREKLLCQNPSHRRVYRPLSALLENWRHFLQFRIFTCILRTYSMFIHTDRTKKPAIQNFGYFMRYAARLISEQEPAREQRRVDGQIS